MEHLQSNVIVQSADDAMDDLQFWMLVKALTQSVQSCTDDTRLVVSQTDHPASSTWSKFLNNVCILCHTCKGGDGVAAIGVQQNKSESVFWLATNESKRAAAAAALLQTILTQLKTATATPPENLDKVASVICKLSILESKERVKNYCSRLKRAAQHIRKHTLGQRSEGDHSVVSSGVLDTLASIIKKIKQNNQIIAEEPFHQKLRSTFQTLDQLYQTDKPTYETARHMVGRLCSWKKRAQSVARNASRFQTLLARACVKIVPAEDQQLPNAIWAESTIYDVVRKILGPQGPIVDYATARLQEAQAFFDTLCSNPEPLHLHAEVAVAHHFFSKGLVLFENYIGCSKPSCYACKLYFDHHPAGFPARQQHGNAWPKWFFPALLNAVGDVNVSATASLARKITKDIRKDVQAFLHGENYGRRKLFESTTGMTKPTYRS